MLQITISGETIQDILQQMKAYQAGWDNLDECQDAQTQVAQAQVAQAQVAQAQVAQTQVAQTQIAQTQIARETQQKTETKYTLEQITRAGADLVTAKPQSMAELMDLLPRFGIQTLAQLQPNQFDEMARQLRALGAEI